MATGTVFLDVDDEITSAAARIRGSEATKVALVVPHGSRISTSRMNFRLLSREAVVNNRRLSIVAADPATRALAASAGLPVYATVAEFDSAAVGPESSASAAEPAPVAAAPDPSPEPEPSTTGGPGETARSKKRPRKSPADKTQGSGGPAMPVVTSAGTAAAAAGTAGATGTAAATGGSAAAQRAGADTGPRAPQFPVAPSQPTRIPAAGGRSLPRLTTPTVAAAAAILLAIVVAGVGAFLFLPAAEMTVTPREEPVGPISLVVRADPDATAPDSTAGNEVVPAIRLQVPVEVSDTFATTGRRVEEKAATGSVTFRNKDFTSTNTIPGGSTVSTQGGVKFKTVRAVTVPKAKLVGLTIVPSEADVGITAVKPGLAGNVEPNTITVIPAGEDPVTLDVRNKRATSGGTHEEFPRVDQKEVDAALAELRSKLTDAFNEEIDAGAGAPAEATLFRETATLGEPEPTVDPATIVGTAVESFDLGLTATGAVIAVNAGPVSQIAETRLLSNIGPDFRLVEGSLNIVPGNPTVVGDQVSFPVTAKAARVRLLDPRDLLQRVKGQSIERARAILGEFGDVEISTWPDWVSSIPTMDSRVTIVIEGQDGASPGGQEGPIPAGPSQPPSSSPTASSAS
jgi:hypothetical protein